MHVSWVFAILGWAIVALPPQAGEAKKDADSIQGTWAAVSYVEDGKGEVQKIAAEDSPIRWIFKKNKVTFLADVEEASPTGTFKLDPSKKPEDDRHHVPAGAWRGRRAKRCLVSTGWKAIP